jgi:elongation factor G
LSEEEIGLNELEAAIRQATVKLRVVPVLCGAALRNKGIQPLLDGIVSFLPSPLDVPPIEGHSPLTGREEPRPAESNGPFAALAFKVMMEQSRKVTYIRVYSGSIKVGDVAYNPGKKANEKLARLLKMHSNKRERIERASAGDIIAVMGLKHAATGDTLCDENNPVLLEPISFNQPVISMALEAKQVQDQDKLLDALKKLSDEDPTFKYRIDEETGQTLISGMGELHLEIIVGRLQREFYVATNQGRPQVVYRETITKKTVHEEVFQRELAGQQHFAGVRIEMSPRPRGRGNRFVDRCANPDLTEEFLTAIQEGSQEAAVSGPLMGYPVIDVETALVDAQIDENDSDALAFKVAASMAFQNACAQAAPALLEPIMAAEIIIPEEFMGEVIGDLNIRQGKIEQITSKGPVQVLTANLPLSKMFGYSTTLRSLSQGRGTFTMQFDHYDRV